MNVKLLDINKEIRPLLDDIVKNAETITTETELKFNIHKLVKRITEEKIKNKEPVVIFSRKALNKVKALVSESKKEIAWHGVVFKKDNTFTIKDILVYPQVTTGATADALEEEYAEWNAQLEDDIVNNLRMQGHSHVNMEVRPSGTDEATMSEITKQTQDYYIFMIVNKKEQVYTRLYDVEENLVFDGLKYYVEGERPQQKWAKEAIKTHVQEKTETLVKNFNNVSYADYWKNLRKQK